MSIIGFIFWNRNAKKQSAASTKTTQMNVIHNIRFSGEQENDGEGFLSLNCSVTPQNFLNWTPTNHD